VDAPVTKEKNANIAFIKCCDRPMGGQRRSSAARLSACADNSRNAGEHLS